MARQVYKPVDPVAQMYRAMLIQRLLRKQQAEQVAAREAAQRQMQIEQERLVRTPGEGWSAAPGARNTNVPFIMGEGGQHGYDELYKGSPYADQGRNWASPGQWERYTDHGMTDDGTLRLPDWLRTPDSGLGPAFEPSPELQTLREQVRTLRGMAPTRNDIMARSDFHDQLARAVAMAEEDSQWEGAWDEYRGVKPVAPGIADIYGPYDDSQDRYADASPLPGMIESAFPESPMPPPSYGWGAEQVAPDRGYIVSDPITRSGGFPEKFSATPAGRQRAATALDFARPLEYQRGPIPKGVKNAMEVQSSRPIPPGGLMPVGEEDRYSPGMAPYLMPPRQPRMSPDLGISGGGGWAEEAEAQTMRPRAAMPEGPSMWDNYDPEFIATMHTGDPAEIDRYTKSVNPWG
jgi:hypothetical protein